MNAFFYFAIAIFSALSFAACWLGWQLLRQNGRILLRLDEIEQRLNEIEFGEEPQQQQGLAVGTEAPSIELPDLDGKSRSLAEFRGNPALLIFFNPKCGFCREMAPKLHTLTPPADTVSHPMGEGRGEGIPQLLIISTGDLQSNRKLFSEH